MRFIRAEIFGFGKWVDTKFNFSPSGLSLFYGENEAGKSTLQQFILYILFGLTPKKLALFSPKNSSRVGGMLTIEDDELGLFTIQRTKHEVICFLPEGLTADQKWLESYLSGLSRDVFENIYAFSAEDLFKIQQIKSSELSDVLFSVSLSGAELIAEADKQLTKRLGDLYKKTGTNPQINQQLALVKKLAKQYEIAKQEELTYNDKKILSATYERDIDTLQIKINAIEKKKAFLEKWQQLLPYINELSADKKKLAALKNLQKFPEDGIEQLNDLQEQLAHLESESVHLEKSYATYKRNIAEQSEFVLNEEQIRLAEELANDKTEAESRSQLMTRLESELEQLNNKMMPIFNELNIASDQYEQYDFPFYLTTVWQDIVREYEQLTDETKTLADDKKVTENNISHLKTDIQLIEQQLLAEQEIANLENKVQLDEQAKQKIFLTEQFALTQEKQEKQQKIFLIASSALALVMLLISLVNQQTGLTFFSVVLLLGIAVQFYLSKKSNQPIEKVEISPLTNEELLKITEKLTEQEAHRQELRILKHELKQFERQILQMDEQLHVLQNRELKLNDNITDQRTSYPFLHLFEPPYWLQVLTKINEINDYMNDKKSVIEQYQQLEKEEADLKEQFLKLQRALDWHAATFTWADLERLTKEHETNRQLMEQNQRQLTVIQLDIEENKSAIDELKQSINDLMSQVDVETVSELHKLAEQHDEKYRLEMTIEQKNQQFLMTFPEEQREIIFTELKTELELIEELNKLEEEKNIAFSDLMDKRDRLAANNKEVEQMEQSHEFSTITHRYTYEKERLNELAENWAVIQVAYEALQTAKKQYQEKYLRDVIRLTTDYFGHLTKGKYQQVFPPTSRQGFKVEMHNHTILTVEELSKGTIDQLYVSLRLAISQVMGEEVNLPIMIDDAFVNFDLRRTKRMIQLLQEYGKKRQVLFFSCDERFLNLIEQGIEINVSSTTKTS